MPFAEAADDKTVKQFEGKMMWTNNNQTEIDYAKDACRKRPELRRRSDLRCQSGINSQVDECQGRCDGPIYISSSVDLYPY